MRIERPVRAAGSPAAGRRGRWSGRLDPPGDGWARARRSPGLGRRGQCGDIRVRDPVGSLASLTTPLPAAGPRFHRRFPLARPHGRVAPTAGHGARHAGRAPRHARVLEHQDLVGIDDGGEAMGDHQRVDPGDLAEAGLISRPVWHVERRGRLVEKHDGGGALQYGRAMATRRFSPPESFSPRSPTRVAKPSGSRLILRSLRRAMRAASFTSSSLALGRL